MLLLIPYNYFTNEQHTEGKKNEDYNFFFLWRGYIMDSIQFSTITMC